MALVSLRTLACFLILTTLPPDHYGTEAAISCGTVVSPLNSCIPYLRRMGALPATCCNGVRSFQAASKSPSDRQTGCGCLKSAAARIPGLDYGLAVGLPGACGISMPYKISPTIDCSKIR